MRGAPQFLLVYLSLFLFPIISILSLKSALLLLAIGAFALVVDVYGGFGGLPVAFEICGSEKINVGLG